MRDDDPFANRIDKEWAGHSITLSFTRAIPSMAVIMIIFIAMIQIAADGDSSPPFETP
jgi:hypothetical protein